MWLLPHIATLTLIVISTISISCYSLLTSLANFVLTSWPIQDPVANCEPHASFIQKSVAIAVVIGENSELSILFDNFVIYE